MLINFAKKETLVKIWKNRKNLKKCEWSHLLPNGQEKTVIAKSGERTYWDLRSYIKFWLLKLLAGKHALLLLSLPSCASWTHNCDFTHALATIITTNGIRFRATRSNNPKIQYPRTRESEIPNIFRQPNPKGWRLRSGSSLVRVPAYSLPLHVCSRGYTLNT